jgi:hypothetical protein
MANDFSSGGAVERYAALDLSRDGAMHRSLIERAPDEAMRSSVNLTATGDKGTLSQGLTPAMNQWLASQVSPSRMAALAELEAQSRAIKIANNVDGFLYEIKHDKIERERAEKRLDLLDSFNRKNKNLLEEVGRLQGEHDDLRASEGGRDAKLPNKWIEFGVLIPLILLPESLLNFESFRRAPIIQSDAMAVGATILVGIGIAAAAYCIGLYIRQFHYFSRPDDRYQQVAGWPLYTWGSSALSVSLGSVAVARYYYLLPKIQEAIVLGGSVPNLPVSIGGLLFGNLICFLVGAILTFFLNDPNPVFAAKAESLQKARRRLGVKSRKELDGELDVIDARAKREREEARRRADQMMNRPGYGQLQERLGRLTAKDSEIIGALNAYRGELVRAIHARGGDVDFEWRDPTGDRADPVTRVKPEAFLGIPLDLSRSV